MAATRRSGWDIALERKAFLKLQAFHSALGEDSQIYSPDEQVENFGLFDKDIEEQRDERLRYLSELRDFKDAYPNEFRRIRQLPLRARCGRRDPARAATSLVFIRDRQRDAFYRLAAAAPGACAEIGFVEMARAFRAEVAEPAAPLPAHHHDHVLAAVADARAKLVADTLRERAIDRTLNPHEQKAVSLLAAASRLPHVAPAEQALLLAGQHAIRLAKFADLPRQLGALQKAVAKEPVSTAAYLDKLLAILRSYPLLQADPPAPAASVTQASDGAPDRHEPAIILSESFVAEPA